MSDQTRLQNPLRAAQILAVALIMGQLMFAGVILFLQGDAFEPIVDKGMTSMFPTIGIAFGVACVPMAVVLRKLIWAKAKNQGTDQISQSFVTGTLTFLAILEGGSLMNMVFWLITGDILPYAVVAGVLLVIQTTAFPRAKN